MLTQLTMAIQFCFVLNVEPCSFHLESQPAAEMMTVYTDPKYPQGRPAHGECHVASGTITLNQDHIGFLTKWELRELIWHEMGHCISGLGHTTGESIMNPNNPNGDYWVKKDGSNWGELVEKLRRQAQGISKAADK